MDWNECVIPVSLFAIDVTNHDGLGENLIEFTVEGCGNGDFNSEECIDTRVATAISPVGGEIVVTVSHLHAMTLNATLWGEDGRLICETSPIYGKGHESGNETGYVVGIRSCYGNAGSPDAARINQGEKLTYVVQSTKFGGPHTGLMAIVGLKLVSDGVAAAY